MKRWTNLPFFLGILFAIVFPARADSGLRMFVAGRVINWDTGQGVENVRVSLKPLAGQGRFFILETRTDKDGYFIFKGVPAGKYLIYFSKFPEELLFYDYSPKDKMKIYSDSNLPMAFYAFLSLEVKEGENISWIRVYLRKGAVIKGRVLKPDGTPFEGAEIGHYASRRKIYTDENGYFVYPGVPPLKLFTFMIHAHGYPTIVKSIPHPEYGKIYTFTFRLCSEGGKAEVRGEVVEEGTGKPIKAEIWLETYHTSFKECLSKKCLHSFTYTDEHGRFEFHCFLPGEHEVTIIPDSYDDYSGSKEEKIFLREGMNIFRFEIKRSQKKKKEKPSIAKVPPVAEIKELKLKEEDIDESCCDYKKKIIKADENICKKVDAGKDCLGESVVNCVNNMCKEGIKIVCLDEKNPDCKETCGDIDSRNSGTIYLCPAAFENEKCGSLESTKFHEIMHLCDNECKDYQIIFGGLLSTRV